MERKKDRRNLYQNYQRNLIRATISSSVGINNNERLVNAFGEDVNKMEILVRLKRQSKFTTYWFIIFITLGLVCLALDINNWLNVIDLFVVMINIYLLAKGKVTGIVIGIMECFLYAFICYQTHLYGEIIKALAICAPLNIVSLISWIRESRRLKKEKYKQQEIAQKNQEDITIKKLSKKSIVIYCFVALGCVIASYFFLKYVLGQTSVLVLGSISLTICIVGKIFTSLRYMDSWLVFVLGDVICLGMWTQTLITTPFEVATVTMIIYYLACLSNDLYAFFSWKSMYRKVVVNGGVLLAKRKIQINKLTKLQRRFVGMRWNKHFDSEEHRQSRIKKLGK